MARKTMIKKVALACAALILFHTGFAANPAFSEVVRPVDGDNNVFDLRYRYSDYLNDMGDHPFAEDVVDIDIEGFISADENARLISATEALSGFALETEDFGSVTFPFEISEEGYYNIRLKYYPTQGKGATIARTLLINDEILFDECRGISFTRSWTDSEPISKDEHGNDIRPTQKERPVWMTRFIRDNIGYYDEPLKFFFEEGFHTITLDAVREPLTIGEITLLKACKPLEYEEVYEGYIREGHEPVKDVKILVEGEHAVLRSDSMIYPISDRSSPATSPADHRHILLNTIGSDKWQTSGQWIKWEFEAPESGLYKINIRYRQNIISGAPSFRKMYINGEVPFAEAEKFKFSYDTGWRMSEFKHDGEEMLFHLQEGKNTLKMEVVLGELTSVIRRVEESMGILSEIYRNFLMVIGPSPDTYRDYQLEDLFPEELDELMRQSDILKEIRNEYVEITGTANEQAQVLQNVSEQAERFYKRPERIPREFNAYVNNISALGNFLSVSRQHPLEIDYLLISSPDTKTPKADDNIISRIWFSILSFLTTFVVDYSVIGREDAELTVWIGSGATGGRDQANVLNQMIRNYFEVQSGHAVKLELVPMGALLPATVAGRGPDIALSISGAEAINFAIRGAVTDLAQFDDFEEVSTRFRESALVPLTFRDSVYGLPETQNFPMMFYRRDIMDRIGLEVPQTWQDVIIMLPELQKRRLNFGLPLAMSPMAIGIGLPAYCIFLFQSGGELYNTDGISSAMDTREAIDSFVLWTDFYTQFMLPQQYDPINRFRTGEIPILIADYGTYNQLSVFAPELDGLWDFALVPGTEREDGTIDRSVSGTITTSVLMKDTSERQAAWEFLKWWTGSDVQILFARELESIMGTAARYAPANIEALYQIPWGVDDFEKLMEQWEWVRGIPEVPGSYMTPRYLDFAFKQVVIGTSVGGYTAYTDPGEVLLKSVQMINSEIDIKREEFGLTDIYVKE